MKNKEQPKVINSISELHRLLGLEKPKHPLITLINHADEIRVSEKSTTRVVLNFYNISIKKSFQGQLKYGKNYYDFDEGTMSFLAPKQVLVMDEENERNKNGWSLLFHPDLIRSHHLSSIINKYGFFSYGVNEALHLSEQEESTVETLVKNIKREYKSTVDLYSQDVMVSNIDLLLNYCNRFYNRQFITRKMASNDLLVNFETILHNYFKLDSSINLPTVKGISKKLNVSPSYLSDMLRTVTGQNTQQHIHAKIIEKAKEYLTTTSLSVSEIAYQLGFEYPQSFNKLFKKKTDLSPLEFRKSFN